MSDAPPPEGKSHPFRARYPRRRAARFLDADDHNPWILEDCADCGGRGTICFEEGREAILGTCPGCAGLGTSGEVVRYFGDVEDPAEIPAAPTLADGRATCPSCHEVFAIADPRAFTGRRHIACGHLLRLDPEPRDPPPGDGA